MDVREVINRINGPHVLYLIREEKVKNLDDLLMYLTPPEIADHCSRSVMARVRRAILM
jgi:hypothetical protein